MKMWAFLLYGLCLKKFKEMTVSLYKNIMT